MTEKEFDTVKQLCITIARAVTSSDAAVLGLKALTFERARGVIDADRPTDPVPHLMQGLARTLVPMLPARHGFILLVFPFAGDGRVNYVSNAAREGCIAAMKEFLIRNGAEEDWMKHV